MKPTPRWNKHGEPHHSNDCAECVRMGGEQFECLQTGYDVREHSICWAGYKMRCEELKDTIARIIDQDGEE